MAIIVPATQSNIDRASALVSEAGCRRQTEQRWRRQSVSHSTSSRRGRCITHSVAGIEKAEERSPEIG
ncbi:hypothetical protein J6590_001284 [Homalodisca vitripennis]|nr:hypothetical protein J6590_001284 [Homalodisca vitripennis]